MHTPVEGGKVNINCAHSFAFDRLQYPTIADAVSPGNRKSLDSTTKRKLIRTTDGADPSPVRDAVGRRGEAEQALLRQADTQPARVGGTRGNRKSLDSTTKRKLIRTTDGGS